nr:MAG TPA: hypothetical protein [Bacteriophage sp.]
MKYYHLLYKLLLIFWDPYNQEFDNIKVELYKVEYLYMYMM